MADVAQHSSRGDAGEGSKIKHLMGRTPGILKSKFLSVIGNSNEILNGISSKLDIALSLSSSSSSDDDYEDEGYDLHIKPEDEYVDIRTIDFESRKLKERRAHEEVLSGRFRHPNLTPRMQHVRPLVGTHQAVLCFSSSEDSIEASSECDEDSIDSKSSNPGDSDIETELKDLSGLIPKTPEIDINPPTDCSQEQEDPHILDTRLVAQRTTKTSNSSTLTSLNDPVVPSASFESSDLRLWIRSESENSVPSWASSISLDSHFEDNVKEFMKHFVAVLFSSSSSIGLELKSEFGQKSRTEVGRLWFSRFLNSQRAKTKKVDETTFYSLVQYFAIVLFECHEAEDYSPAKNLMSMCFTFYHDIQVPGCEPYREYLFTYLRQQPIWHTLRFWDAAFFDAVQYEISHRTIPVRKGKVIKESIAKGSILLLDEKGGSSAGASKHITADGKMPADSCSSEFTLEQQLQQSITFSQLGSFTCNMHAFGLSKELCLEFLKKQCTIGKLNNDQEKLLKDNITRMYLETEKWGA